MSIADFMKKLCFASAAIAALHTTIGAEEVETKVKKTSILRDIMQPLGMPGRYLVPRDARELLPEHKE